MPVLSPSYAPDIDGAVCLQKRETNQEYTEELARIVADTEPVECHAPAGSVIFWHSRLVHSAGKNSGTAVRSGVIYEYYKKADPSLDNSVLADVERGNPADMWCAHARAAACSFSGW
jgi:ectoine hydroxylase-related dioxygenase (phytanoyl-CoA dioxygenase family)